MSRFIPKALAVTTLLGLFATASVAEAARPRTTADRRHRAEHGFWESRPSQNRTYARSSPSVMRSSPQPSVAPQTYVMPRPMVSPTQSIARQQIYYGPRPVMQPPRVAVQPGVPYVSQPMPIFRR